MNTNIMNLEDFANNQPRVFWVVWTPNGQNPLKQHETFNLAYEEALRLSAKHPERKFYVCQAVGIAEATVNVEFTRTAEKE
jgi:hypothetical protein